MTGHGKNCNCACCRAKYDKPWNKGLTKETDERVRKYAEKMKGHPISEKAMKCLMEWNKKGYSWNRGLTKETDERIRKYAKKVSKTKTGMPSPHKGKPSPFKGKKLEEIVGEKRAKDIKNKVSESKIGNRNPMKNIKHREKMRHCLLEVAKTEEYRMRCSEAGKKGGKKTYETIYKNSPYVWKDVNFLSEGEREFAKKILKKPIKGVNCHIKVGNKVIDFYPQEYDKMFQGIFVEFHPYDFNGLSDEEYYEKRRKVIDSSKYKDKELVVITDSNIIKET